MNARMLSAIFLFAAFSHHAFANQLISSSSLQQSREQIIDQYVLNLKNADYKNMAQLFEKNGIVISTSKGKVNAKDFFNAFLPEIVSANTQLNQVFVNNKSSNRLAARFHFNFKLKDGEMGEGEYVDEFIFAEHSSKLTAVYMFENVKFMAE